MLYVAGPADAVIGLAFAYVPTGSWFVYGGIILWAVVLAIALLVGEDAAVDTESKEDSDEAPLGNTRQAIKMITWLSRYLYLPFDLRALALSRIFIGLVATYECFDFMVNIDLFISRSGICQKSQTSGTFDVFTLFQDTQWVLNCLLAAQCVAAVTFTLGALTRASTLLLFCFHIALHSRIKCVLNSGDRIVEYYFFWMFFLPAGARWSLDALLGSSGRLYEDVMRHARLSSRGLSYIMILELSLVYYLCGFQKNGPDWQERYDAAWYASQSHFGNEPIRSFIRPFPKVMVLATWFSLYLERYGWLFFFIPNSFVRLVVVAIFIGFHIGMFLFLNVGFFQLWMLGFLVAMLPAPFFDICGMLLCHIPCIRESTSAASTEASASISASNPFDAEVATSTEASTSTASALPFPLSPEGESRAPSTRFIPMDRCRRCWSCFLSAMLVLSCPLAWTLYWAHAGQSCGRRHLASSLPTSTYGPCIPGVAVPEPLVNVLAAVHLRVWRGLVFTDKLVPKKLRWNYLVGYSSDGSVMSLWDGNFKFDGRPFTYNLGAEYIPPVPYGHSRVRKFFGRAKNEQACILLKPFVCGSFLKANKTSLLGFELIDAFKRVPEPSRPMTSPKVSLKTRCRLACNGSSSAFRKMQSPMSTRRTGTQDVSKLKHGQKEKSGNRRRRRQQVASESNRRRQIPSGSNRRRRRLFAEADGSYK